MGTSAGLGEQQMSSSCGCHASRHRPLKLSILLPAAELNELRTREKEMCIEPDWEINAFLRAEALVGKRSNIGTEYVLRLLGLDICADTLVGNQVLEMEQRHHVAGNSSHKLQPGACCARRWNCGSLIVPAGGS